MIQSPTHTRKWLALAAIAFATAGICLQFGSFKKPQRTATDDGWRRTSLGWERTEAWARPAQAARSSPVISVSSATPEKSRRWDTHPAALALVQLAATVLALFSLPIGWRLSESNISSGLAHLPRAIANSFRASAFY